MKTSHLFRVLLPVIALCWMGVSAADPPTCTECADGTDEIGCSHQRTQGRAYTMVLPVLKGSDDLYEVCFFKKKHDGSLETQKKQYHCPFGAVNMSAKNTDTIRWRSCDEREHRVYFTVWPFLGEQPAGGILVKAGDYSDTFTLRGNAQGMSEVVKYYKIWIDRKPPTGKQAGTLQVPPYVGADG